MLRHRWRDSGRYTIGRDRYGWPVAHGLRTCRRCGVDEFTTTEKSR